MNVNEYGIIFVLGVSYDLSSMTNLSITFNKPDGTTLTVATPDVTISATPIDTTKGTFAANTYALYTFAVGDVDPAGDWTARLTATKVGVRLISDVASFTVSD